MYKIVGADQKEYGPVSAEQVIQWIHEGRANGHTIVRLDDGPWKPLSAFPEFAAVLGSVPPPPLSSAPKSQYYGPMKTNGFAITGLVLSVLGLFQCCAPIFAVLGVVFSTVALVQITRSPNVRSGKGLAVAGLVISTLGLILFFILWSSGFFHHLIRQLSLAS